MARIESVDTFRFIAISAVIAIHTSPFGVSINEGPGNALSFMRLNTLVDLLARFGVPYFFVISGYFWGIKIRNGACPNTVSKRAIKKLLILFLVWSAVYIPFFDVGSFAEYGLIAPLKTAYWHLLDLLNDPATFIFQGTKGHLWFLVGLLCSIAIATPFVKKRKMNALVALSIGLYLIGLSAKAYSASPLGISLDFNTRNGPFFGTLFFVSGYLLSGLQPTQLWLKRGLLIAAFGYLMHFSELYYLWKWYGTDPHQDYVFGTYFVGIGAAVASLSNHPSLIKSGLGRIGQLTLGIYAIHYIFIDLLRPLGKQAIPLWDLWYFMLVLGLSVLSVVILAKKRVIKEMVQ